MFQSLTRRVLCCVFAFALVGSVLADELDDQYLKVLSAVDQAEALEKAGKLDDAKTKYLAIHKALLAIKKADPTWKPNMVSHRLTEVEAKLTPTSPVEQSFSASAESASPKTTSTPKAGTAATKPVEKSEPDVLKLVDAGREPRRALRFQPKVGDKHKTLMTTKIGMEMSMGGNAMPKMAMPIMKLPMDISVDAVAADGDISFTTTMGELELEATGDEMPGMADAMKAALGGAKGMTTSSVKNSRGVVKSADLKLAADASPQLRQSMEQMKDSLSGMSSPFPEEPIGIGAKWEYRQVLKSQGMTIKQASTYELVALEGNRAEVKITILQSAANQKISSPAMPGMKVDLDKMEGTSTGKAVVDLTRLLPVSGEVNSEADIKAGMNLGGQKQSMDMKTTSKTKLESQ
jgi:hypothetical protein